MTALGLLALQTDRDRRIRHRWTDGQMDGHARRHRHRGGSTLLPWRGGCCGGNGGGGGSFGGGGAGGDGGGKGGAGHGVKTAKRCREIRDRNMMSCKINVRTHKCT